jgi:serine/threonine-protein kinase
MVMEFMDGDSLAQRIRQRGSMAPKDLYPVARQLLDALAAAHNAGIVHRDLKPDNVFLLKSRRGQPDFLKLLDFGISKFSSGPGGLSMTRTGAVMGTPYYMAPEQAKGAKDIDHRVDLYAAGVILYEALAGRVPFLADTFNELLFKIVLEKPEALAKVAPHVDPVLAGIVETAMAREPGERFQTAEALRDALDHWASQQGHQASAAAAPATSGVAPVPAVAQPMAATGANNMLGSTPGNWAGASTVEGVVPPPPKSNVGLIAAVAAAVVLLGGGGVVLHTRGSHEPATAASASGAAAPPASAAVTTPPAPSAAAPAPSPEAPRPAPSVAVAPASPEPSASAPPVAAAAPVKAAPRPASPPRPAVTTQAKPAPKAAAVSQPSGGRKIRQSL